MNFHSMMLSVPSQAVFQMDGYQVWCPTVAKGKDGRYHMLFSCWPASSGHDAWVTQSKVGHAISDNPLGPYQFQGIVLQGSGGTSWDADVIHNPTMIAYGDKYYLYYMANYGNGEYWDHRNHQRIGVAEADHPGGPWRRSEKPIIEVTLGSWDHLLVSNPTVTVTPQGKVVMVYKGVGQGELPKGGAVVCGVAEADHPLGPFRKVAGPIMVNPDNDWSVEDPFIWFQDDRFYALVKDFQGYFTGTGESSVALFESEDGTNWHPSEHALGFKREIAWSDGSVQPVEAMERPQLLFENGRPIVLYCAIAADLDRENCFNVAIPLKG
ncbi:glycoside hydrolase family protein [Paenibacillus alba]|uniref:Glycoside hydrolase family protein n=1 Tax=Paenibacillus alba TaxID=1197127 RepID=A0ABU6G7A2_9BACL|nr:glycoside hydrolase family protein [Paenibacillus alba]MEC0228703.1 glycoside hydrolase family protein [Paenibacillus alba]